MELMKYMNEVFVSKNLLQVRKFDEDRASGVELIVVSVSRIYLKEKINIIHHRTRETWANHAD